MDKERYDKGQKLRREVLGDRYVDAAAKNTTDFNRPFQEFITENVWGNIWSRPGLDRALVHRPWRYLGPTDLPQPAMQLLRKDAD